MASGDAPVYLAMALENTVSTFYGDDDENVKEFLEEFLHMFRHNRRPLELISATLKERFDSLENQEATRSRAHESLLAVHHKPGESVPIYWKRAVGSERTSIRRGQHSWIVFERELQAVFYATGQEFSWEEEEQAQWEEQCWIHGCHGICSK
ncbi:hypothetical protein K440DRAFT_642764 [Wilcoxina mikolae CBS 423.85]|nr:hypothetical protein K440DRAFT_642764 [Wilcoxina mikolae CBS 423.85]